MSIEDGFKMMDQLNNSLAYKNTHLSRLDLIFFSCQIVDIMKGQLNFQEPMDKNLYQIIIKNNKREVGYCAS